MKLPVLAVLAPALALSLAALSPRSAFADESPQGHSDGSAPEKRFGSRGVLVVGSDARGSLTYLAEDGNRNETLFLAPSVDYFVAPHLTIGGSVAFEYYHGSGSGSSDHGTSLGVGPRIGYEIALGDVVSLWPKAGFVIGHQSSSNESLSPGESFSYGENFAEVEVNVPFLFHPAKHFFLGLGPNLTRLLTGDNKYTLVGVAFTVGGWVGL